MLLARCTNLHAFRKTCLSNNVEDRYEDDESHADEHHHNLKTMICLQSRRSHPRQRSPLPDLLAATAFANNMQPWAQATSTCRGATPTKVLRKPSRQPGAGHCMQFQNACTRWTDTKKFGSTKPARIEVEGKQRQSRRTGDILSPGVSSV